MGPEQLYLQELIDHGLLIPMGVDGVYGRSAVFEDVLDRFGALVTPWGRENGAEAIRFPPVMNRHHFEQSGYLKNFPHLAGTIHCFHGGEREHLDLRKKLEAGEDWTQGQQAIDIVSKATGKIAAQSIRMAAPVVRSSILAPVCATSVSPPLWEKPAIAPNPPMLQLQAGSWASSAIGCSGSTADQKVSRTDASKVRGCPI